MAYERRMPTKDEIIKKAIELFHEANPQLPTITPEESELKEGSYWERARSELMSGIRSELEKYLSELESEADKIREELGIEKPLPVPERLTELENQLARVEERYKTTKERLKETEEELRKIREAKPTKLEVPKVERETIEALLDREIRSYVLVYPKSEEFLQAHRREILDEALKRVPERVKRDFAEKTSKGISYIEADAFQSASHEVLLTVSGFGEKAKPPSPPTGLTEEDKTKLEDLFKRIFLEAGVSYAGKMAEFRDELRRLQEDLKDVERVRAVELAEKEITEMAKRLIPYKPPPPVPVPVPVTAVPIRVAIAEERVRTIEKRMCLKCREYFTIDLDLMRRVTQSTTEIRGVGRVYQSTPILKFPERFYHECPNCRLEQFGYRDIYDAIAYLLAEAKRSNYNKIKLTKDDLRAVGLDKTDLDEIQTLEAKYR